MKYEKANVMQEENLKDTIGQVIQLFNDRYDSYVRYAFSTKYNSAGTVMSHSEELYLNPNLIDNIEYNRVTMFVLLHELGHMIDKYTGFSGNASRYIMNYKMNPLDFEARAWVCGLRFGLQIKAITPEEVKFMYNNLTIPALETYNYSDPVWYKEEITDLNIFVETL